MHTEPSPWLAALQAWWLLDGNGPYLWSSYGLAVLALVAETAWVRRAHRQALGGPRPTTGWQDEDSAT